jgi:hypothetical protein
MLEGCGKHANSLKGGLSSGTTPTRLQGTSHNILFVRLSVSHLNSADFCADRIETFAPTPERPFVLGLPTGSSPEIVYRYLVQAFKLGKISFSNVVTFNMVSSELRAPHCKILIFRHRTNTLVFHGNIPRATTVSCTIISSLT